MRHAPPARALTAALLAVALFAGCGENGSTPASDEDESFGFFAPGAKYDGLFTPCEGMLEPLTVGRLEGSVGDEVSGIVASRTQPGVFWAINDRGNAPAVEALDRTGDHLVTLRLPGASNVDWEDIAVGMALDGAPVLWLADIGDNDRERETIILYRVDEPKLEPDARDAELQVSATSVPLRYPDGEAFDAETLFVDPADDRLWIVTRRRRGEDRARLFWTPPPESPTFSGTLVEHETDHEFLEARITGGDATEDAVILLADDDATLLWRRRANETFATLVERRPCIGESTDGTVGSVALDPFTGGWTLVAEGDESDVVHLGRDTACPASSEPESSGQVSHDALREASGLVSSVANPGHLWTHNDGADPRVFLIDTSGAVAAVLSLSSDVEDLEDIALGPGPDPDRTYLYLADIGDNALERDSIAIHRWPEPELDLDPDTLVELELRGGEVFEFEYDDGDAHDAEALMVDPISGDLLVLTKRNDDDSRTLVFSARAPLSERDPVLREVFDERRAAGLDGRIVAGDISRDGQWLLLTVKDDGVYLFPRSGSERVWHPLQLGSCWSPVTGGQVEAVGFDAAADGYWMMAEGDSPELVRVRW